MIDLFVLLIPILPLAGFAITAVIGRRLDKQAHIIPVGAVGIAWAMSMVVAFLALTHGAPFDEEAAGFGHAVSWLHLDPGRGLRDPGGLLRRCPDRLPADRRDDDRAARPRLLDRVHGPRPRLLAVLRLPEPVHVLDAAARPRRQLPRRLRRLGAGRPVELPAHRLLDDEPSRGAGGEEGVHRQPRRRRRVRARDHADLRQPRHAQHPRRHRADRRAGPRRSSSRSRC